MEELYWITRFDILNRIFITFFAFSIIGLFVFGIATLGYISENKQDTTFAKFIYKLLKSSLISIVIFGIGLIFTPTTNEALLIYGVGNTIDYIKTNDKAKQLPDKCVDALDTWVESIYKTEKQNNGQHEQH